MISAQDLMKEENVVKGNWIAWGKPGNFIMGTLIGKSRIRDKYSKEGKEKDIFEFIAHEGEFNEIIDKIPSDVLTKLEKGDIWNVDGKKGVGIGMKNIKLGQIILIKFIEEDEAKDGNYPRKIIKIYKGQMDEGWLKEQDEENE